MFYQWGRKDPSTFATNSEPWGAGGNYGKYAVKIYTIDGVLIYQEDRGRDNKDKQPAGGIITTSIVATSMMETIKNPTTYYGQWNTALINQSGHTKDLWDYYWTSFSRGTDGKYDWAVWEPSYHNDYLDVYKSQRLKSIYDPCPFGFKVPSNGTWSQFNNKGWVSGYCGGTIWNMDTLGKSWFQSLGRRYGAQSTFDNTGGYGFYYSNIPFKQDQAYGLVFHRGQGVYNNWYDHSVSTSSVRCIDFAPRHSLCRHSYALGLSTIENCG